MRLNEIRKQYVASCINMFDEDGNSVAGPYRDVSDLAYNEENNFDEIDKHTFINNVEMPSFIVPILKHRKVSFFLDTKYDIFVLYDVDDDVHYFFE